MAGLQQALLHRLFALSAQTLLLCHCGHLWGHGGFSMELSLPSAQTIGISAGEDSGVFGTGKGRGRIQTEALTQGDMGGFCADLSPDK